MKDLGNTVITVLFVGFFYGLYLLLMRLFNSTVWPAAITIVIGLVCFMIFLEPLKKLAERINERFKPEVLIDRLYMIFTIIGVIATIRFVANKKNYDIYISYPESKTIELIKKNNWGFKSETYYIEYIGGEWMIHKNEWESIPEVKGVMSPDYFEDFSEFDN